MLRFFLNHRTFMRSEHPERVSKSPTELLTGKKHPHWLELLGFERFKADFTYIPHFVKLTVTEVN